MKVYREAWRTLNELDRYYQQMMEFARLPIVRYQEMFDSLQESMKVWNQRESIYSLSSMSQREFEKLTKPFMQAQDELINLQRRLSEASILETFKKLALPSEIIRANFSALSSVLEQEGLRSLHYLQTLAIRPILEYQSFSLKVLQGIKDLPEGSLDASIGIASVECTGTEVTSGTDFIVTAFPKLIELEIEDLKPPVKLATLNLFNIQKSEITICAKADPILLEKADFFDRLPSFKLFRLAIEVICPWYIRCNEKRASLGKGTIFKPTDKIMRSISTLPYLIAQDEMTFGEFIDTLYIMLYEGSGDAKRVLLFMKKDEMDILWNIKQLRNYYIRHDPEHGEKREIIRKRKTVGEIFQSLIGKPLPEVKEDFQKIQAMILKDIAIMLRTLYKRIDVVNIRPEKVKKLAEQIASIQGCSTEAAQKILDLQGAWRGDQKVISRITDVRKELNKWKPQPW